MREIVDDLYIFMPLSREPGFLKRAATWMRSVGRYDEPKVMESFLPAPAAEKNYMVATLFGSTCAGSPSPPSEADRGALYGIRITTTSMPFAREWTKFAAPVHDRMPAVPPHEACGPGSREG